MKDDAKFIFLLTTQSVAKIVAQFIVDAFDARLSQLGYNNTDNYLNNSFLS